MRCGRRAMAAGAALLATATLLIAGVQAGCGGEGSHTSASPSAAASSAPTETSAWAAGSSTVPAVLYSPGPGSMSGLSSFTLGWEFKPTLDIAVFDLGYVDPKQDGLVRVHRVGIFDAQTDELIASVTVGPKSGLDGFFRWESLEAPAVLRAGHSYLVAARYVRGDEVRGGLPVWAPEVGHVLTEHGRDFTSATSSRSLSAPHQEAVWEGFMAANFKFRPAAAASPTP